MKQTSKKFFVVLDEDGCVDSGETIEEALKRAGWDQEDGPVRVASYTLASVDVYEFKVVPVPQTKSKKEKK